MSFLCNLNINPLSDIWFANILSYSIGSFVILLFLSFFLLISLMWSHFCCFQLLWIILLVSHRKIIGKTNVEALFLYDLCYWNWKSFSKKIQAQMTSLVNFIKQWRHKPILYKYFQEKKRGGNTFWYLLWGQCLVWYQSQTKITQERKV